MRACAAHWRGERERERERAARPSALRERPCAGYRPGVLCVRGRAFDVCRYYAASWLVLAGKMRRSLDAICSARDLAALSGTPAQHAGFFGASWVRRLGRRTAATLFFSAQRAACGCARGCARRVTRAHPSHFARHRRPRPARAHNNGIKAAAIEHQLGFNMTAPRAGGAPTHTPHTRCAPPPPPRLLSLKPRRAAAARRAAPQSRAGTAPQTPCAARCPGA